jgi:hypothetical protein
MGYRRTDVSKFGITRDPMYSKVFGKGLGKRHTICGIDIAERQHNIKAN